MSMIDEIKRELQEISPWPWIVEPHYRNDVLSNRGGRVCETMPYLADLGYRHAEFIAKSPERITAMLEYIEAVESVPWIVRWLSPRLTHARKKLGLE